MVGQYVLAPFQLSLRRLMLPLEVWTLPPAHCLPEDEPGMEGREEEAGAWISL